MLAWAALPTGRIFFTPRRERRSKTRRYGGTIQPHQEMLQVLSLGLADCPGVGWSEGISHYISLFLNVMRDGIHKGAATVRKLDDDRVPMTGYQCDILSVDNSGRFVLVLIDDNLHVTVRQNVRTNSHWCTGYIC